MDVKNYILNTLQEKHTINENTDLENLNYIEEGYVDSFGIFQFVSDLEEHFEIEFTDEEFMSEEFRFVGKLVNIVQHKLNEK